MDELDLPPLPPRERPAPAGPAHPVFSQMPIDQLVDYLLLHKALIPNELKRKLQKSFSANSLAPKAQETEISLEAELREQVNMARQIRESMVDDDGTITLGRDVTSAMSAINGMISTANRIMKDIYTQKRVQLIETTTVEVLKELDPALQQRFLDRFRERLME